MGVTNIPWVINPDGSPGETWNWWSGCKPVGPECDDCYAKLIAENPRYAGQFPNGFGLTLRPKKLTEPLHWRKPRGVFTHSMSDILLAEVPRHALVSTFAVMAATRRHTYMPLTKRAMRARRILSSTEFQDAVREEATTTYGMDPADWVWPLPNVRLGVSVGIQDSDHRIVDLLQTPAAVRWVSVEPLIDEVDLTRVDAHTPQQPFMVYDVLGRRYGVPGRWQAPLNKGLDWVVVGGESGRVFRADPWNPPPVPEGETPYARPMDLEWMRLVVDQCRSAGVPVFAKQTGSVQSRLLGLADRKGETPEEWPDALSDLRVREFPGFGTH